MITAQSLRVLLLADTHGRHDPAIDACLPEVDEVWHAGDWVSDALLQSLRRTHPVHSVRGNNDRGGPLAALPEEQRLDRLGWRILMRHIAGAPDRIDGGALPGVTALGPHLLLHGHSHKPMLGLHSGVVWCNPGSAGPRRFSLPRSLGLLELTPAMIRVTVRDIDSQRILCDGRFLVDGSGVVAAT